MGAAAAGALSGLRWARMCCCRMLALSRRQDEVSVIGEAIEAKVVAGEGYRRIAARVGAYPETVRGWLRRFAERAEPIRAHFTRCAVALDPELGAMLPAGGDVADALEAIAVAARAWVLRFGPGGSVGGRLEVVGRGAVAQHESPLGGGAVS